jgi:hypothetical protein
MARTKEERSQFSFFAKVAEKLCAKCKTVKPASAFGPRYTSPDGLRHWCNECGSEYQNKYYRNNLEENRRRKREHMARARLDPMRRDKYVAAQRAHYRENRKEICRKDRELRAKRFFWARGRKLKGIFAKDLAALWKKQRGLCALSGRKLDRTAHLDHIIARTNGGTDEIGNFRWLDPWVNIARQNLTDEEFISRCNQIAEWIGKRIVDSVHRGGTN